MTRWKRSVNEWLTRLTGYQVVRARRAGASPGAGETEFPADYDESYREIIRAVRPFTMTGNDKLHALITATRYIQQHRIPGAIVECGVWRGGSMHAVARTLDELGDHSREIYLFDTFEGMPPPTDKDVRIDGATAEGLLATRGKTTHLWAVATLDDVENGLAQLPYPKERFHCVPGRVEDTVPGRGAGTDRAAAARHRLVRVDCPRVRTSLPAFGSRWGPHDR